VIFSFWRPDLLVLGAYLFGIFSALGPTLESHNITVLPSEFYSALPFLMTIIALAATSTSWGRIRTPAALGVPYTREDN
jgi:simple sugar transport system permease protein